MRLFIWYFQLISFLIHIPGRNVFSQDYTVLYSSYFILYIQQFGCHFSTSTCCVFTPGFCILHNVQLGFKAQSESSINCMVCGWSLTPLGHMSKSPWEKLSVKGWLRIIHPLCSAMPCKCRPFTNFLLYYILLVFADRATKVPLMDHLSLILACD